MIDGFIHWLTDLFIHEETLTEETNDPVLDGESWMWHINEHEERYTSQPPSSSQR